MLCFLGLAFIFLHTFIPFPLQNFCSFWFFLAVAPFPLLRFLPACICCYSWCYHINRFHASHHMAENNCLFILSFYSLYSMWWDPIWPKGFSLFEFGSIDEYAMFRGFFSFIVILLLYKFIPFSLISSFPSKFNDPYIPYFPLSILLIMLCPLRLPVCFSFIVEQEYHFLTDIHILQESRQRINETGVHKPAFWLGQDNNL